MSNVGPAMRRDTPPGMETRTARQPLPLEAAGGRAYMDPRFREIASYVLAGAIGDASFEKEAIVDDARLDHRAYLSRHVRDRRL